MPAAKRCRRRQVADACGKLYLAEPAPGVRGRLIARFAPNTKIRVRSLDDLRKMAEKSVDLVIMNSVAQYMTPTELDTAFATIRRLLKPGGRLIVGDVLRPEVGMVRDVIALLRFARATRLSEGRADRAGLDRIVGLPAIALARRPAALQRSRHDRKTRRWRIYRLARAFQYRAQSVADDVRRTARVFAPIVWARSDAKPASTFADRAVTVWARSDAKPADRALPVRVNRGSAWPPAAQSTMMGSARWRKASTREQCIALYPGSNPGRASSPSLGHLPAFRASPIGSASQNRGSNPFVLARFHDANRYPPRIESGQASLENALISPARAEAPKWP